MLTLFKITWISLRSRKVHAAINIIGLSVGIAVSLIIFLVISYELNYDSFQLNKDRIYRVVTTYSNATTGEITGHESAVPVVLPFALHTEFPQIEKVAAAFNFGEVQIHIPVPGKSDADEKKVKKSSGVFYAEPSLFEMFDFIWLAGNAKALKDPNTVVLNESTANEFFGEWTNALGSIIQMTSFRVPLKVVGVYKDLPSNTDMEVKIGASYATFRRFNAHPFDTNDWEYTPRGSECFLLLPKGSNPNQYNAQLSGFAKKYFPAKTNGHRAKVSIAFQSLNDMHLNEDYYTFKGDALTHKELWSLAIIGLFMLLVACVNFINLATAQSINRTKEIGVRKVLGSNRKQILKQFLSETAFITFISIMVAFFIAHELLPFFSHLMQKPLSLNVALHPSIISFLVILGITVSFLAGMYPGIVLSGFNPVEAIKLKINAGNAGGKSVRRSLVVFQFVIAQFLIIGTIVVVKQMQFFRNQSMGFQKNSIAMVELPSNTKDQIKYNYLKTQLLKIPGITAASFCLEAPSSLSSNNSTFYFNNNTVREDFNVNRQFADTGYLNTFQIKLLVGRVPYPSDSMKELLVNETLVKKLGLVSVKDILGKTITFDEQKLPIVGVMHDFNSKSLKEPISPFVLTTYLRAYNYIALRINSSAMQTTLNQVEKTFSHTYPTYVYELSFLDERIARFYTMEALTSHLFKIAALLAIFISCLGLYGLVSFMAAQRTKEVGIRKVLGASARSIVYLFSKEYVLLVGIAFVIAAPVGYFIMQRWLSDFYYHVELAPWVFILAILISMIIALLTVGYKAVTTALSSPVKSLKME